MWRSSVVLPTPFRPIRPYCKSTTGSGGGRFEPPAIGEQGEKQSEEGSAAVAVFGLSHSNQRRGRKAKRKEKGRNDNNPSNGGQGSESC